MIRVLLLLGAMILGICVPVLASMPRVRALDPSVLEVLTAGYRASATIRDLVDRLERSDVIVLLERQAIPINGVGGTLVFVGRAGGFRYVRIAINTSRRTHAMALLAHELQHALEVADDPKAVDEATFEALYRRIGEECRGRAVGRSFDTNAARAVTQQVLREVRGALRRTSRAP